MSERDRRIQLLMSDRISAFEKEELLLGSLVADLESLENSLESTDEEWRAAFHNEWWTLEQVHAVALDREEDPLSDASRQIVIVALSAAKQLLAQLETKRGHN